jgi:hypothetical protein
VLSGTDTDESDLDLLADATETTTLQDWNTPRKNCSMSGCRF